MNRQVVVCTLVAVVACRDSDACDEDPRAQVLTDVQEIEVDGTARLAEVADTAVERERGWRYRVCARDALLLRPDAPAPLPIWGCALTAAVDLLFVRNGVIVDQARALPPCAEPCTGCPLVGEGLVVDAVIELPHDPSAALDRVRL